MSEIWIDEGGAERILAKAGIRQPPDATPELSVVNRDREAYLFGLFYEIAYAVAQRSANPAAMAPGNTNPTRRSYADRRLMNWALRSARQLDKLISSTY